MTDTTTLPKVIIVGGGYAGTHAAMKLHNSGVQMNLTFITTCTHLNVNFGNVRAAVTETFHHRIFAPYENMFQTPRDDRHIVTGKVDKVQKV
jgi:NADH dehydrogenase FAD-containing subunit